MRRFCGSFVVVVIALVMTSYASAAVLTFDDISPLPPTSSSTIPNGYGGFNWANMGYINTSTRVDGYRGGTVSGDYVAFNLSANVAMVTDNIFDFQSVYLAAAWNNGLSVRVKGFLGAALLYDTTVGVTYNQTLGASATLFNFNYTGIDKLEFSSFGGTDANPSDGGSGEHFAMDNFTTGIVPEPSSLLLSTIAFATFFARRRRRRA